MVTITGGGLVGEVFLPRIINKAYRSSVAFTRFYAALARLNRGWADNDSIAATAGAEPAQPLIPKEIKMKTTLLLPKLLSGAALSLALFQPLISSAQVPGDGPNGAPPRAERPDGNGGPGGRMEGERFHGPMGERVGGPGMDHFGPMAGHGGPDCGLPLPRHLKLSEAQEDKIFAIFHAQAPQVRELHRTAAKADEALRKLGRAAQYDDAKAKSLADTAAKAHADLALLRVRGEHQIFELLTPEQKRQLAEADARRDRGEKGEREGRREGDGPRERR